MAPPPADAPADFAWVFVELGAALVGLAALARLASRFGFSTIPLYLLGGLAFGNGGLVPLRFTEGFVHVGAEIGVVLLLFMLGLEYTGEELRDNLRTAFLIITPPVYVGAWILLRAREHLEADAMKIFEAVLTAMQEQQERDAERAAGGDPTTG